VHRFSSPHTIVAPVRTSRLEMLLCIHNTNKYGVRWRLAEESACVRRPPVTVNVPNTSNVDVESFVFVDVHQAKQRQQLLVIVNSRVISSVIISTGVISSERYWSLSTAVLFRVSTYWSLSTAVLFRVSLSVPVLFRVSVTGHYQQPCYFECHYQYRCYFE
jgi:hypothetical protein